MGTENLPPPWQTFSSRFGGQQLARASEITSRDAASAWSRKAGTGFPPARSPLLRSSFGLTLRRAKAGRKHSCAN